ncbi:hypothetical protein ASPZODRAFT_133053 [Penicilliopsis zonata CBS 506.65]|uniref:Phosphatidylglycerol lysyltransferase C-terminal domain-containing protein n=1 Tax=Penicilliopsis zonata CBS 506.65 TaxID=1073090 RepID=A0A1L9SFL3_9EURO|nr:hypothetical protein ASPZODRAFT_133053 [Penicilliopsis zonata CBS 506.65]OJJ46075.1 hypothetical protein ASPZODRAFT_133053 [Penicilliopsis zonata CBS 506.65]
MSVPLFVEPGNVPKKTKQNKAKNNNNNKNNTPKTAKKDFLVDTVGNSLVEQLNSSQKPDGCPCCASLVDSLRGGSEDLPFTADRVKDQPRSSSSSCCSSGSDSSRTVFGGSTPNLSSSTPSLHHSHTDASHEERPALAPLLKEKYRKKSVIFTLEDFRTMKTVERLTAHYGRVSHMGILDRSYSFFVNKAHTAALSFKVKHKVAIVGGDPLCAPEMFGDLLAEFAAYRKDFSWGLAFLGVSDTFAQYARDRNWTTMQFATERVLNPMTNEVLLEKAGKRIIVQNKQLLNPNKGGTTLSVYVPADEPNEELQRELTAMYDAWRVERNDASNSTSAASQAFVTVFDPFSLPDLMTYIYTRGPDGTLTGFAALRRIGANQGYHLDPCIAAPGETTPRGITDLLTYAAMALLHRAGVSYLSLGYEPLDALGEITGMPSPIEKVARSIHRRAFRNLPIGGKKAHHDKFRPDADQESGLFLVFPAGVPGLRQLMAMAHMANISIRRVAWGEVRSSPSDKQDSKEKPADAL